MDLCNNKRLFSCDWCWLQRVARGVWSGASPSESGQLDWIRANLSAIQKSTVRDLPKFASVHELKQFLLENYSEIRKYTVLFQYCMKTITPWLCKCSYSMYTSQKSLGSQKLIIRQRFFNRVYTPNWKTLSGKKHKSLTMRPNGVLGSVKTCLYS